MSLSPELRQSIAVGHRRARVAIAVQGVGVVVGLIAGASLAFQTSLLHRLQSGADVARETLLASDARINALGALLVALRVLGVIVFLVWLHRAFANARRLQDTVILPRPGNAVVSFFIPFVNFVRPVVEVSKLHRALDPDRLPLPVEWKDNPTADYRSPARTQVVQPWSRVEAPIALWWTTYLVQALAGHFIQNATPDASLERIISMSNTNTAVLLVGAVASLFSLLLVRAIDRRTAELARRTAALPDGAAAAADATP